MAAIGRRHDAQVRRARDRLENVRGTFRLFEQVLSRYQLAFSYVDTSNLAAVERAVTPAPG
jgi:cystathionine beta-lyase/cystathionine gamma-synthase